MEASERPAMGKVMDEGSMCVVVHVFARVSVCVCGKERESLRER